MVIPKLFSKAVLREIAVFVAAVDSGSLAAAARSLRIERSAATRDLARLEQGLGRTLAERTAHRFALTPHGENFLCTARDVLAAAQAIQDRRPGVQTARRVTFKVPLWLAATRLLSEISDFSLRWPRCSLVIVDDPQADVVISAGDVDHAGCLDASRVGTEPMVLVAAPTEPLVSHPAELVRRRFVDAGADFGERVLSFESNDDALSVPLRPDFVSSDPRILAAVAEAGGVVARVPGCVVAKQVSAGRLRIVFPNFRLQPCPIYLALGVRRGAGDVAHNFAKLLSGAWSA